ncbi:MAG TPA: ABC transporter ATP-binding protein [Solirubrobacteraceae bacterium]|nr:ABC transporter ATP-binding protein [Solirubrobacteraceae bacterium]
MSATVGPERSRKPAATVPASSPAISIRDVSKSFRLPHEQYHTLKERMLHPFRPRSAEVLRAVQNVTADIARGEFFGIVGRNGSGKSTLLKCLAGIYEIDDGDLIVDGRLSPFIELGVGFNPDLTARDNVIINAIMLGLSRRQALERFDEIIAFAELENFVDLKLKNYSSGMYVRLAFATAVQVDADILLIDEVLAVGDASFQQKCFDEFTRLRDEGRTIMFVTHDMGSVERFCDRAMLLEKGEVIDIGEPAAIARQYNQTNFRRTRQEFGASENELPPENPPVRVARAWFRDPDGSVALTSVQGSPCTVRVELEFDQAISDPIVAVAFVNEAGSAVFATHTDAHAISTGDFPAGARASVEIRFENFLAPGRYRLFATVARAGLGADVIDAHTTSSIIVLPDHPGGGLTDLPHTLEISRD